jgi:hypothetical protein
MTLTIELDQDLEHRIEQEAARRGELPGDYVRAILTVHVPGAPVLEPSHDIIQATLDRIGRKTPEDLAVLARDQGIRTATIESLTAHWRGEPIGEDPEVNEFLEQRRQEKAANRSRLMF